jgi:hypothetical protein
VIFLGCEISYTAQHNNNEEDVPTPLTVRIAPASGLLSGGRSFDFGQDGLSPIALFGSGSIHESVNHQGH